mgnify:CR=1 FL=1
MKDKKILVCDDDQGILEMLELILEDEGYQVVIEPKSVNALRKIEQEIHEEKEKIKIYQQVSKKIYSLTFCCRYYSQFKA